MDKQPGGPGETNRWDRDAARVVAGSWLGHPALSYEPRPRDVGEVLAAAVARRPDDVAAVDAPGGGTTTVLALADRVAATVRRWRDAGLVPGDGVGVAAGNCTSYLVAVLACAVGGTVCVGLSPRLARSQWSFMLRDAGVRLALADPGQLGALREAAAAAGLGRGAVLDLDEATADAPGPGSWARLAHRRTPAAETDFYQVVYTSGTTGDPKASQVVQRASLHSGLAYDRLLRLRAGESTGVLFDLGYISAMHAHVLPALLSGARLVLLPTGRPGTWVGQLADFDVAWAYAVPSWWLLAVREPGLTAAALPHLRLAAAGGAPFPDRLRDALAQRLPDTELLNIYGLSETHSPATVLRGRELWTRPGAAGRPLEVVELDVRADDLAPVPAGEPGEVWIRGSLVTTGYAGNLAATDAAIVDGWFRTGDVGRLEETADGPVLYLLDRVKDLVNRAGVKVYSAEVERVLGVHPGVAEAAVVAAPDELAGETVAVFLVHRAGTERPGDGELRGWVRQRLGTSAAPSVIRWVDDLPRGGTGKTDKRALRTLLSDPS